MRVGARASPIDFLFEGERIIALQFENKIWFHRKGETFVIPTRAALRKAEAVKKKAARSGDAAADGGEVLAPMPGKVTQLRLNVGDTVQSGQVVLVMEAMKMEYTLKAPGDGVVKSISCRVGEQVQSEQILAVIGRT